MAWAGQETPRADAFDATAERVVRLFNSQHTGDYEDIRSALQELAALDDSVEEEVCFAASDEGWRPRVAA